MDRELLKSMASVDDMPSLRIDSGKKNRAVFFRKLYFFGTSSCATNEYGLVPNIPITYLLY